MKIPEEKKLYQEAIKIRPWVHKNPRPQSFLGRKLLQVLSKSECKKVDFECEYIGMDQLSKKEPALYLMNHSCFLDLEIAASILHDRAYHIVCTNDGMVGKEALMRWIGCIPAKKFITDISLVKDMNYVAKKLHSSILMYPEASYSFDGTQTPLPSSLGKCIKLLKIPVVMIRTYGAFQRDPLYNALQLRDTKVTAKVEYLLSKEDIQEKSVHEINKLLKQHFTFDHFRWQFENQVCIDEPFRADGLHRVLYKCCHCLREDCMEGKGIHITCKACGAQYELTEYGKLQGINNETKMEYVTDWYRWERECVKQELDDQTYAFSEDVTIKMLIDSKKIYDIGAGHLTHSKEGFVLTGADGLLDYHQTPESSYSLYADYFWYEIGDMVSIGDVNAQYYCFSKNPNVNVAKVRLATEELYKSIQKQHKLEM